MAEQEQALARDLGFLEAYTMGLGTMIGAGFFVLPSVAAANAGPARIISFAIDGFLSLLTALSRSELVSWNSKIKEGINPTLTKILGNLWFNIVLCRLILYGFSSRQARFFRPYRFSN